MADCRGLYQGSTANGVISSYVVPVLGPPSPPLQLFVLFVSPPLPYPPPPHSTHPSAFHICGSSSLQQEEKRHPRPLIGLCADPSSSHPFFFLSFFLSYACMVPCHVALSPFPCPRFVCGWNYTPCPLLHALNFPLPVDRHQTHKRTEIKK